MRLRSRATSLGRIVAMAAVLAAPDTTAIGQMDLSAWPKVQVEILATDANGDPVAGLSASGVVVREDGRPQTVLEMSAAPEPQSVCILVDDSGSMYSRMPDVQAAATRFLQNLPAEDEVCFASFGWHLQMRRRFTHDRSKVATSIQAVRAEGGTSLRDALVDIENYMRAAAKNRLRAIVVLTDGADNASTAEEQQMRQAMEIDGSPVVHIVRVPASPSMKGTPSEEASEKKAVQRTAAISGGLSYFPRDPAEMGASLEHLNEAMKKVYLLTYTTEVQTRDGRERRLDIKLDKAHGGSKTVLRTPEGYYAPSQ